MEAFIIIYFICGISDVADGILARRLNITSKVGALLDSIADFMFLAMSISTVILRGFYWSPYLIAVIGFIMIIKIVNIAYTRYKFKQWGIIHTIGNKLMGLLLFIIIPTAILCGEIPLFAILLIGILGIYAALEESIILVKSSNYDVNKKSFYL